MGLSINGGTAKMMVDVMENPIEMDDDWGYPQFRNTPYIYIYIPLFLGHGQSLGFLKHPHVSGTHDPCRKRHLAIVQSSHAT